jgi:hypothetical protein
MHTFLGCYFLSGLFTKRKVEWQVKVLIKNLAIFFLCPSMQFLPISFQIKLLEWYTHKTSGFKTSGFETSGFKTSETSGLQNVRFTKRQVYKMSGLQNVRSAKRPVAKKNIHKYSVLLVGENPQVLLQQCLQAK